MPIDFHDEKNRFSYTTRNASLSWIEAIEHIVDVTGKKAADIGCGGGVYTKALIDMGAAQVTALDFSEESLKGARENCIGYPNIELVQGDAADTDLPDEAYDVVLMRAVIHHIKHDDVEESFTEAFRILKPEGMVVVQDRTPDDCLLPGSNTNIRGYFFERFPQLVEREIARRLESGFVLQILEQAGFHDVHEQKLWETRAIYPNVDALSDELLARTGRSILHELTDEELQELVSYIRDQFQGKEKEIVDKDRWTIWKGIK